MFSQMPIPVAGAADGVQHADNFNRQSTHQRLNGNIKLLFHFSFLFY